MDRVEKNKTSLIQRNIKLQEEKAMNQAHHVVTLTMILLGLYMGLLFWFIQLDIIDSVIYLSLWFFVLVIHLFYGTLNQSSENNRLISYFSIISLYTLMLGTLIHDDIPFLMASIFVVFAIGYLYVDLRAASLNHLMLLVVTNVVLWFYPEVYSLDEMTNFSTFYISSFIFIIILLLYLADFIVIKRKLYHFGKLAKIQENEFKVIELLYDLQERYTDEAFEAEGYYKRLRNFFNDFSTKVGVENVFEEQINLIETLDKTSSNVLKERHPEIPDHIIGELDLLTLSKKKRIRHLAMKASQVNSIDVQDEYLSDALFDSMRHFYDNIHIKITVFSVFYVYCRMAKNYEQSLSDDEFLKYLNNSGIVNVIEPSVYEAYLENRDVFDKIFNDAFKEGVKV